MEDDRVVTSFAPVISPEARVVILGSMPGERSLQIGQYYSHPRNLFWPIIYDLVGIDPSRPYETRIARLRDAEIGLWDVLQHCERQGSLDSSIVQQTEVANDFVTFFDQYPAVKALCFNGQKAEAAFQRHVLPVLPGEIRERLDLVSLPSSSPAYASMTFTAKVEKWKAILHYIRQENGE